MCDLRVRDLKESVTSEEVKEAVVAVGGCRPADVQVGRARASSNRLFTVWVRCPVAAARKVVGAGFMMVGLVQVQIEVLERRPLQCYKCLLRVHVIATCTYTTPEEDRRDRCGGKRHRSTECTAAVKCPLCSDLGRPATHQCGGKACAPILRKGKRGAKQAAGGKKSTPSPTPEKAPAAVSVATAKNVAEVASQHTPASSSALEETAIEVEVPPTLQ
ncbi:uncharacterized protein LOC109861625 [Pseudomyrmex gracilis]|uniref:uncharacterized protein LOC109861625 n=1 Tax=Pseudomyrmex gracilis TaxID=219809 RepID=UPI0009950EB8|nr:uncharacterized protein LOC109861625 [Pseudomyrmex gracilis]